jgi:phosphate:Na+ symporter
LFTVLLIAGGVALILFATRQLREGLDRLVGARLGPFLQNASRTPIRAFLAGLGASVVAPSSSTMSALAVQAVQSRFVSTRQMLLIMAGADIGITLMVWLSALDLQHFGPVLILVGWVAFQYSSRRKVRGFGQVALALGLLFQGIVVIQTSMAGGVSPDLKVLLDVASRNPLGMALFAGLLSVFLQSSTATILLIVSLGSVDSAISMNVALPAVVGANVGVSLTTMIMGWSSVETRRLAAGNLLAKLVVAGLVLGLMWPLHLGDRLAALPGDFAVDVANTHTLFNILKAILVFPMLGPLTRLVDAMVPAPSEKSAASFGPQYINAGSYDGVSLAMGQSAREIMRAGEIVRQMLDDLWRAMKTNDESLVREIAERDNQVDLLDAEIRKFLARLNSQPMDADDQQEQMRQMRYLTELEAIGDIIDKNLCKLAIKKIRLNVDFGREGWQELEEFDQKVSQNMLIADTAFQTRDKDLAEKLLRHKDHIDQQMRELRDRHFTRFAVATEAEYEMSAIQLDVLTNLKRINSHVSHVAYAVLHAQQYAVAGASLTRDMPKTE